MRLVHDAEQLVDAQHGVFVPTMGALHAGHAALIARACEHAEEMASRIGARPPVVVSVFVNPTQFDEPGDFRSYPRTLEADVELAQRAGADAIFAPSAALVYPPDGSAWAASAMLPSEEQLPPVARLPGLEDRLRPGHFAGVYGVVRRLFELTRPLAAVFGEKDWQQLQLVRELVRCERMAIDIIAHPTVREPDGLALSSRNGRLTPDERRRARAMPTAIAAALAQGTTGAAERAAAMALRLCGLDVEYAAVRDETTLLDITPETTAARLLLAARVGSTRLIDNALWEPGRSV